MLDDEVRWDIETNRWPIEKKNKKREKKNYKNNRAIAKLQLVIYNIERHLWNFREKISWKSRENEFVENEGINLSEEPFPALTQWSTVKRHKRATRWLRHVGRGPLSALRANVRRIESECLLSSFRCTLTMFPEPSRRRARSHRTVDPISDFARAAATWALARVRPTRARSPSAMPVMPGVLSPIRNFAMPARIRARPSRIRSGFHGRPGRRWRESRRESESSNSL